MSSIGDLQKVYMKDGDGNAYLIKQAVYEGKIVTQWSHLSDQTYILKKLHLLQHREADICLITYPKSGTHWIYGIAAILTSGKLEVPKDPSFGRFLEWETTFKRRNEEHPAVYCTHFKYELMPKEVIERQKIIIVIRNPKSVATSYFSHRIRSRTYEYDSTFAGYLPVFLEAPFFYNGTWFEHVIGYWSMLKDKPNVLFLFYEDIIKDPLKSVQKVSSFLGCSHSRAFCEEVVRLTSVENMKHVEQQMMDVNGSRDIWKNGQSGYVNSGKIDSWKTHFTVAQNEAFDTIYEKEMMAYPDLKEKIKFE